MTTQGLQLGGMQAGAGLKLGTLAGLQQSTASSSGLPPPYSMGTGGLQLGTSTSGLQSGAGMAGGLQLGSNAGGLQLGLSSSGPATTMGGLKLGAGASGLHMGLAPGGLGTSTSGTLKLGAGMTTTGGFGSGLQLGSIQPAGLKLGSSTNSVPTTLTTATASTSVSSAVTGLGGVDHTTPRTVSVDEQEMPLALNQLVDQFCVFMNEQKSLQQQLSRYTDASSNKVKKDARNLQQKVAMASTSFQREAQNVVNLKEDMHQELKNAEISQYTQEVPIGLQHENTSPDRYFHSLTSKYEQQMNLYQSQIEELEGHLSTLAMHDGVAPQTLAEILRLQHKPFLLLAAQLQTIHEAVQKEKEQYMSYRRIFLKDTTDVFAERRRREKQAIEQGEVKLGPTPFNSNMGQAAAAVALYANHGQLQSLAIQQQALGSLQSTGLSKTGLSGTSSMGMQTGLGTGAGMYLGTKTGIGTNGLGAGVGTGIGGLGTGINLGGGGLGRTATGLTGLSGTGLGIGTGVGIGGLGTGTGTVLGTGLGTGTVLGTGLGAGAGLGVGTGTSLGIGMGLNSGLGTAAGLQIGAGTQQPQVGQTRPFTLQDAPLGRKKKMT